MGQISFSKAECQNKKRKTCCEIFLERMDKLIPSKQLETKLARDYLDGQNRPRPYLLSSMLRVHCMQLFYNSSDPTMESAQGAAPGKMHEKPSCDGVCRASLIEIIMVI
jgi:IS5 family transposase